jgi:carbamoyltransferase
MVILSIFWGLCSSAAIYKDGKILAAISEERFTREKNDTCFPALSIEWILKECNIKSCEIDKVALASSDGVDYIFLAKHKWSVDDYLQENSNYWKDKMLNKPGFDKSLFFDVMPHKIKTNQYPSVYWNKCVEEKNVDNFLQDKNKLVADFLNVPEKNIVTIEHHRSHAYYSYYTSPFRGEKVLAFTADGWGDGKNATVGIFDENGKYKMEYINTECNIARVYRYMTLLLGMKPSEHEFKVMGLAPYGKEKYAERALQVFRSTLYVDGLEFKWHTKPSDSYYWFKDRLEGVRFDNIAFALQKWTEDLLVQWVKNAIQKYDIHKIVFSGGVSMNVKAMGKLAELKEVDDIFIGGSAGDESHVISAPYCVAEDYSSSWNSNDIENLSHLYLGMEFGEKDEREVVGTLNPLKYQVIENYSNKQVAELLYDGNIIARSVGKMEFGQRSLGNRSILADPSKLDVKEKINSAIKNRDFWMPFAPIILDSYSKKYLINPKNIRSPYMTLAFDTTQLGYDAMKAACHPSDRTCRAQILHESSNVKLYDLLNEFESLSGRGALMNTSFNLHGYPIVNSPKDAVYVFKNSELDCLVLDNYLIKKINT